MLKLLKCLLFVYILSFVAPFDMTRRPISSMPDVVGKYYNYFINCDKYTYNGYTVDLTKRLRQHNKEIKGGAKSTSVRGPWSYFAILHSDEWTAVRAMQIEWLCRYPTRKKPRSRLFQKPSGRILSLTEICSRFDEPASLYVTEEHMPSVLKQQLPSHIRVFDIKELLR